MLRSSQQDMNWGLTGGLKLEKHVRGWWHEWPKKTNWLCVPLLAVSHRPQRSSWPQWTKIFQFHRELSRKSYEAWTDSKAASPCTIGKAPITVVPESPGRGFNPWSYGKGHRTMKKTNLIERTSMLKTSLHQRMNLRRQHATRVENRLYII